MAVPFHFPKKHLLLLVNCFSSRSRRGSSQPTPPPGDDLVTGSGEEEEEKKESEAIDRVNDQSRRRRTDRRPLTDFIAPDTPAAESATASPAFATINLRREYMHAVDTNSYKEIWYVIRCLHSREEGGDSEEADANHLAGTAPSDGLIARVLQPNRTSIEEALRGAPPNCLTRLVLDYFNSSENTSLFCLSLCRVLDRARSMYAPIRELVDILPSADGHRACLTDVQCDWAFRRLLGFVQHDNPFPIPSSGDGFSFHGMRVCFAELKKQLDLRLYEARRKRRLAHRVTRGIGACLIFSTVGLAVAGLVLSTNAIAVITARPFVLINGCLPTRNLQGGSRRQLRDYMDQLDAASRGTYVVNKDLETIERLVARLHANVESDRELVRLGLEIAKGQQYSIEEVVRQFRRNHPSFLQQLEDLEEHICCFLASLNSTRLLLLRQIQRPPLTP